MSAAPGFRKLVTSSPQTGTSCYQILHSLPLILLILAGSIVFAAFDKSNPSGEDLLQEAAVKGDLYDLSSFVMKADIRVDRNGKLVDGTYTMLWNGPEQWREEISFADYSQVEVGGKGVVSTKRTTDFLPLQIEQLSRVLSYGRARLAPEEKVKRIHERRINGVKVECIEIANATPYTHEVCLDESTHALIRQSPFLDRDLMPVGSKLFPHTLSYIQNGKPVVEVHVTDLTTATEPLPASDFTVPAGAILKPGCRNPKPGRLVRKVPPMYPEPERLGHVQGTVSVYVVIGTDGLPQNARVVSGVDPGLNKSTLDAVRQWSYDPYTCNGTPVEIETVLSVNYR